MSKCLGLLLVLTAMLSAFSQSSSSTYQPGTIVGVTAHQNAPGETDVVRYDVVLKVGNTLYVVLYTPSTEAQPSMRSVWIYWC